MQRYALSSFILSHQTVLSILFNSAHINTPLHQNVPSQTPTSSPRVFHSPKIHRILISKSNGRNGVINSPCATRARTVNTTRIQLELNSTSIDSNSDRSFVNNSTG